MARVNGVNVDEEFDEFKEENKRWTWASELALKKRLKTVISRGKFLAYFICDINHCATREWPTCSDMALIGISQKLVINHNQTGKGSFRQRVQPALAWIKANWVIAF